MDPAEHAVRTLLGVPAGRGAPPQEVARELLTEDVRLFMDGAAFKGRRLWGAFVTKLNKDRIAKGLDLEVLAVEEGPTGHSAHAQWHQNGQASGEVFARFVIHGGRAHEIHSHRRNYVPVWGEGFLKRWGYVRQLCAIAFTALRYRP